MNKTLWQYYVDRAEKITNRALTGASSLDSWKRERSVRHREFMRSMGLWSLPTGGPDIIQQGEFRGPGYRALRLAYSILPDVWGTGNLLLPDPLPNAPCPAILHPWGHSASAVGDSSARTLRWPRAGYACLIFDSIAQTDNTGFHRGLASGTRPDWISLGYTAAGGELLNGLRAFEVLRRRPEIDPKRIGVTGHSGGGAQSLFLAAAEERIAAAAPSGGVTCIKRSIGDRAYRGHCDCMYALGIPPRDNIDVAALIAPRPLLFCYGSRDPLYCPEEYRELLEGTRRVYRLYGQEALCALHEYAGEHSTTEDAEAAVRLWFDTHVGGVPTPITPRGDREISESQATVFNGMRPVPDRLDLLPELMSSTASHPLPQTAAEWPAIRDTMVRRLREVIFADLERYPDTADFVHRCHNRFQGTIGGMEVWLELPARLTGAQRLILAVCAESELVEDLSRDLSALFPGDAIALLEPRATGLNSVNPIHAALDLQRVGALLGRTLPLMWIEDLRHTLDFMRRLPEIGSLPIVLYGRSDAGVACLYHAILNEDIAGVFLIDPPDSHRKGGYIPAILREMDITTAVGLLAPRLVAIKPRSRLSEWYLLRWGHRVYHRLGIPERHALGMTLEELRAAIIPPTCSAKSLR